MNILLLESHTKHALSVIRSLGRRGYNVFCDGNRIKNPNIFSRYCKKLVSIDFRDKKDLLRKVRHYNIDILLPIGYESTLFLSRIKDNVEKFTILPIDEYKKISRFAFKDSLYDFFQYDKKVAIPKTVTIYTQEDMKKIRGITFPVIVKNTKEGYFKKYSLVNSEKEAKKEIITRLSYSPVIVQEYIKGEGRGFFGLADKGKILAYFQHRRIREFPPKGGVSSFSESIFDKKLLEIGKRIAKKMKINMHFMAEFRYNTELKKYFLIEMNFKFWGSLDLAIKSGVDFPLYVVKKAVGEKINFKGYKTGVKYQWCFPEDFSRIFLCENKLKCLRDFLSTMKSKNVYHDIDYLSSDPLPTIFRSVRGILYGISLWLR